MRGCQCAGATCGCSVIAADDSVDVSGTGTVANPFKISANQQDIVGQLVVEDTSTLNLSMLGSGTPTDPYSISGVTIPAVTASGTYTPTLQNLALGSGGTIVGSYKEMGGVVTAEVTVTLAAGFSFTGVPLIGLPVALTVSRTADDILGSCTIIHATTSRYEGKIVGAASAVAVGIMSLGALGLLVAPTATVPATFAAGDKIKFIFSYPGAT